MNETRLQLDWRLIIRRITAYLVDCLCIVAYGAALFVLAIMWWDVAATEPSVATAIRQQFIGLTTLTLPVVFAFSFLESRRRRVTPGKMLLGLSVQRRGGSRLTFGRSLARNALKFLPWEIAHTGVNQLVVPAHPWPWLGVSLANLGMALVLAYLLSVVLGRGRTIYDLVVDAEIVRRRTA